MQTLTESVNKNTTESYQFKILRPKHPKHLWVNKLLFKEIHCGLVREIIHVSYDISKLNSCFGTDPETKCAVCLKIAQSCTIVVFFTHTVSLQNPTRVKFSPCTLSEGLGYGHIKQKL